MIKKVHRQISLSQDSEEIIEHYFAKGSFSRFVEEQLRAYKAEHDGLLKTDKEIEESLKGLFESAVRVINKYRGTGMMLTYAKRWENIIKEQGGFTTYKELIEMAMKEDKKKKVSVDV